MVSKIPDKICALIPFNLEKKSGEYNGVLSQMVKIISTNKKRSLMLI